MAQQRLKKTSSTSTKLRKFNQANYMVDKKTFYFVCILGIFAMLLFYYLFFRPCQQKTDKLEADNKVLQSNVEIWRTYFQDQQQYQAENEEMQAKILESMSVYPADIKEEDVLMLAVDLQKNCGVSISNINLSGEETIYSIDVGTARGTQIEGFEDAMEWKKEQASFVLSADYSQLKNCIARIYAQKNKVAIHNITLSKSSEDGALAGNIDLSFYDMSGTGKEYVKPDIAPYLKGTNNIFGVRSDVGEANEQLQEEATPTEQQ